MKHFFAKSDIHTFGYLKLIGSRLSRTCRLLLSKFLSFSSVGIRSDILWGRYCYRPLYEHQLYVGWWRNYLYPHVCELDECVVSMSYNIEYIICTFAYCLRSISAFSDNITIAKQKYLFLTKYLKVISCNKRW